MVALLGVALWLCARGLRAARAVRGTGGRTAPVPGVQRGLWPAPAASGETARGPTKGSAVESAALVVAAVVVFGWGACSGRLERADLTAPIVFTAVGAALAGFGLVHASSAPEQLKPLVENTLVLVLFSDAARVRVHDLRGDLGVVLRLLAVGLPLTLLAGWGLVVWLLPGRGLGRARLVGPGWACGWPGWAARRWHRPTRRWACLSSPTRPCRRGYAGSSPWRAV